MDDIESHDVVNFEKAHVNANKKNYSNDATGEDDEDDDQ
jgi:hypothetical protein